MSTGIGYTYDDSELQGLLGEMEDRIKNPAPALKQCGLILMRSISKNFKEGGRPVRWKPSERAKDTGGQTLVKSARLKKSFSMTVAGNLLRVFTNVAYAAIHHFGGSINKNVTVREHYRIMNQAFGKPIAGRRVLIKSHSRKMNVEIDARRFAMVQDEDLRVFTKITGDHVTS